MSLLLRAAAVAAFLLPLAAMPTFAQNYRGAFGLYGGGSWFSDLNNGVDDFVVDGFDIIDIDGFDFLVPAFQQFGFAELSLENGWIAGTQAEYWFGHGRVGLRLNGAYTERPFELDIDDAFFDVIDIDGEIIDGEVIDGDIVLPGQFLVFRERDTFGDVNVWYGDLDLMVRLLRPEPTRKFAPFVSLGGGFVLYDPAGDGTVLPIANAEIGNRATRFALVPSIGFDYLPNLSLGNLDLGLRAELADHYVFDSPMDPFFEFEDEDFDGVHNVRLTAGVFALFGRLFEPPRAAIAPAPPPPAPAPIEEEMVMVCVIDPTLDAGIDMADAVYLPSTNDTLVIVDGDRVDIETVGDDVMVAGDTDWFVRGAPLTLTVDDETTEYVTFGGARIIEAEDLAYLGTVDGLPVFANEDEVQSINSALLNLSDAYDLQQALERDEDLLEDFNEIEVLYVPLQPTGCVFQPVRQVEEVRKVRG